jgi:hypothetical protein
MGRLDGPAIIAWLLVGIPILWGVYNTFTSAMRIFQ